MLPLFTFPLAFAALAAVPALLAIYWLRNRYKRQAVSSLMLWMDQRQPREGGSRVERLQIPLLLLLELLVLVLLIIAASDPRLLIGHASRPLMVVLDDSYSMQAGHPDSARSRGIERIRETLDKHRGYATHLIIASISPQALGEPTRQRRQTMDQLKRWQCTSAYADLPRAISFATELGGPEAHILVITDQQPPTELKDTRTQWQAVGKPMSNLAIINAVRSPSHTGERCLLEVANLSPTASIARLEITFDNNTPPQQSALQLAPSQVQRITFDVPPTADVIRVKLNEDDLMIDNEVVLLPERHRPVHVTTRIADEVLATMVYSGLASTGRARLDTARTELLITDQPQASAPVGAWKLVMVKEDETASYVGPFVMDRAHPLTQGLSLAGTIWGSGSKTNLPGLPVITVGNTPLLTDERSISGRHELHLRIDPKLSTMQDSANWPILFWNLIEWRSVFLPGIRKPNLRLGASTTLTLHQDAEQVQVLEPDGHAYNLPVNGRQVLLEPRVTGLHQITAGAAKYQLAVNALSPDESDLSTCRTNTWGDWLDERTLQREYQSIAWLFILAALLLMVLHQYLIARSTRGMTDDVISEGVRV